MTCPFDLPQLFLTSLGLIFPLFVEVIIIRFFCPRFILLLFLLVPLVGTSIVQIGLGSPWPPKFLHLFRLLHPLDFLTISFLMPRLILFRVFLPRIRSASHDGLLSVLPSLSFSFDYHLSIICQISLVTYINTDSPSLSIDRFHTRLDKV